MDNEISEDQLQVLKNENVNYQSILPHSHCRELEERATQTWKNNFKAGLVNVDPAFALKKWDHLIEQAKITLNLLNKSRSNKKL